MKQIKKLLAMLLVLCLMVQFVPTPAKAASVTLYQAAKDSVPLRTNYGSEYEIVSRISKAGATVTLLDKAVKKVKSGNNTWLKVRVSGNITNNGAGGDYWVFIENMTLHQHHFSGSRCSNAGCPAASLNIKNIGNQNVTITKGGAPLRAQPYNDGAVVRTYKVGDLITVTGSLTNYKGSVWYQVADGNFIFSDNTSAASAAKSNAKNNSENNKTPAQKAKDFITLKSAPCIDHKYSQGKCTNCGYSFPLMIFKISGNFRTNKDNAVARAVPYQSGVVKKTYGKAGSEVKINAMTYNSAGNPWFRTTDGYWIYGVEEVSLKSVSVHASGFSGNSYTYQSLDDSVKLVYKTKPANAVITSVTWSSSDPRVIDVDKNGNLTRKGYSWGKTIITCTVKSQEGNTAKAEFEVSMPELLTLQKWDYNNQTYNYKLALQCAEYMALAYENYTYKDWNGQRIVFQSDTGPRLANALQEDGMNYKRYNFGDSKTRETSPVTIASKMVNYNGGKTPLIYVIITGSAGIMGWQGNMMMTGSGYNPSELQTHYTFRLAAQDIQNKLAQYASQFGKKPIVVVTGHSRGGAVGNLLAGYLNNDSRFEKVYAYNFAVPNATRNPSSSRNIFNICNTEDFVTMIPMSDWGYTKNGVTLMFTASQAYATNTAFRNVMDQQMTANTKKARNKPDYSYFVSVTPEKMAAYISGTWPSVELYYNRIPGYYGGWHYDDTAYHYMFEGLAGAAATDDAAAKRKGLGILGSHFLHSMSTCVFSPISTFFIGNGIDPSPANLASAFADSHHAYTYYAAILAGVPMREVNAMAYFSEEETAYGNGTVALNADEQQVLLDFFGQSENALALEEAGWDINDPNTWEGVKWDLDGHVVDLDLSYMGLGGWLDITELPEIQTLNVDGNVISMLAASGCEELTELSCFMNQLTNLSVDDCSKLQQLDCAFNEITSLDLSNLSQLTDVNCYGNQLTELDLDGASSLQTLRCGNNNLSTVDVSTNSNLSTLFCEGNRILEAANPQLSAAVAAINEAGGAAEIGGQQYLDNFDFNADELENLTTFANTSANLEKLGWDLSDPWSWQGVEWKIYGGEYHIAGLDLSGLDVEGDLNLPDAAYLESLSCSDNGLSSITLTGCSNLGSLNCSNGSVSSLELSGCSNLSALSCSGNYLAAEEVESSLNQIGLQTGVIDYEEQNIDADEDNFDPQERDVLVNFLGIGDNAEALGWDEDLPGTWSGVKWTKDDDGVYHVRQLDLTDKAVQGKLDLTDFSYLEDFSFAGTLLEQVVLPDCLAFIPEYAFYNSAVQFVTIPEGVTRINQSAFAYSESLQMIALPTTLAKIQDMAFYGCTALKDLIFLGDEPMEIGSGILEDTSAQLMLTIRSDRSWNENGALLSGYSYQETDADYLVRIDDGLQLVEDSVYDETNQYPGTDVAVTLIRMTPEQNDTLCILSVTSDDGAAREIRTSSLNLEQAVNHIVFEDVNLQFAGEELCNVQVFLLSGGARYTPLALQHDLTLTKPVQSEQ